MPPSLLSRLSSLRTRPQKQQPKSHITDGPDLPKVEIGLAKEVLKDELLRLYWDGVRQDLPHLVSSLRALLASEEPIEEEKNVVYDGYDQWVDNITQGARDAPAPGGQAMDAIIQQHAWNVLKDVRQGRQREEIRSNIHRKQKSDVLKQRARLLLQSAQWLDIDKLIEHRDPPPEARLDPANLETFPSKIIPPPFETRKCHECDLIMRGSEYYQIKVMAGPTPGRPTRLRHPIICETCYCKNHYAEEGFTKVYKHSELPAQLQNETNLRACRCEKNAHDPNNDSQQHWNQECPIRKLHDKLADGRFESTRHGSERGKTLANYQKSDAEQDLKIAEARWRDGRRRGVKPKLGVRKDDELAGEFAMDGRSPDSKFNATPDYLKPSDPSNPWGMVHMALRIGPLVIENGVEHTNGVLITTRKAPELHSNVPEAPTREALVLLDTSDRKLFSQNRPHALRRYKGAVKQIVGGTFCGFLDKALEDLAVESLMDLAKAPASGDLEKSDDFVTLWSYLEAYLEPNAKFIISTIASTLVGPVNVLWNQHSNNCQTFCNRLLEEPIFQKIFVQPPPTGAISANPEKPYLISFVNNENSLRAVKPVSKRDIPNGFVEEFLLRIKHGRHDASDMFESLMGYWYDWGCFEQPLYRYQDLFPWDCTEAYHEHSTKCGRCSLSKHVWTAPFDAWSLISLHLTRSRYLYPKHAFPATVRGDLNVQEKLTGDMASETQNAQTSTSFFEKGAMSDEDWNQNRLTVLLAQDALLSAATAMASSPSFMKSVSFFAIYNPASARIKLGGLHRAQPYSHHFEKGAYRRFYVAPWATRHLHMRIDEYERLRDNKANYANVHEAKKPHDLQALEPKFNFVVKVPREKKMNANDFHGHYGQNWTKYVEPEPMPGGAWYPSSGYSKSGGSGSKGGYWSSGPASTSFMQSNNHALYVLALFDEAGKCGGGGDGGGGNDSGGGGGDSGGGDGGGGGGCGGCGG